MRRSIVIYKSIYLLLFTGEFRLVFLYYILKINDSFPPKRFGSKFYIVSWASTIKSMFKNKKKYRYIYSTFWNIANEWEICVRMFVRNIRFDDGHVILPKQFCCYINHFNFLFFRFCQTQKKKLFSVRKNTQYIFEIKNILTVQILLEILMRQSLVKQKRIVEKCRHCFNWQWFFWQVIFLHIINWIGWKFKIGRILY